MRGGQLLCVVFFVIIVCEVVLLRAAEGLASFFVRPLQEVTRS